MKENEDCEEDQNVRNICFDFKCEQHRGPLAYCICNEYKDDNFVSCDECQIWYHCKCIDASYEIVSQKDYFVCRKCEHLKECLMLGFHDSLADYFKNSS